MRRASSFAAADRRRASRNRGTWCGLACALALLASASSASAKISVGEATVIDRRVGTEVWTYRGAHGAGAWAVARDHAMSAGNTPVITILAEDGTKSVKDLVLTDPGTEGGYNLGPAVAFDGTHFVAVWMGPVVGGFRLLGQRFAADGSFVDAVPFSVSSNGQNPQLAFDGTQLVLLWEREPFTKDHQVLMQRLSSEGKPIGTPVTVLDFSVSRGLAVAPMLACKVGECLATWRTPDPGAKLVGRRIAPSGTFIGDATAFFSSTEAFGAVTPTPTDSGWFAVWTDHRGALTDWYDSIYGTRLGADLVPAAPEGEAMKSGINGAGPVVATSGVVLAAWSEIDPDHIVGSTPLGADTVPITLVSETATEGQAGAEIVAGDDGHFLLLTHRRGSTADAVPTLEARVVTVDLPPHPSDAGTDAAGTDAAGTDAAGEGGTPTNEVPSTNHSGCGCSTAIGAFHRWPWSILAIVGAVALRTARRNRRLCGSSARS